MVSPDCTAVFDVCFMRVSQLTAAGAPQPGAGFGYVTDTQQKATIGLTIKAGTQFDQINGCGAVLASIKEADKITGATISVDIAKWERDLLHLMTGGTTFATGGHTGGWQVAKIADGTPNPVCIELWSKAIDGSAAAVTAISTPNAAYHVFVLPFVTCTFQPFTLQNGFSGFTISGVGAENTAATANGPFNDWPSWVAGKGGITAVIGEFETGTVPTAACGVTSVPSGS